MATLYLAPQKPAAAVGGAGAHQYCNATRRCRRVRAIRSSPNVDFGDEHAVLLRGTRFSLTPVFLTGDLART
jgi:hypothetical protein